MEYEQITRSFQIPTGATADTVAEQVRQILSMKVAIVELHIVAGSRGKSGEIVATIMAAKMGPPHGEIQDADPESIWDVLTKIKLEEFKPRSRAPFATRSVAVLICAMAEASKHAQAPLAWLVRSPTELVHWLRGSSSDKFMEGVPSTLLGLPIIDSSRVPDGRMIMLCGRSSRLDPLRAEWGYVVDIETRPEPDMTAPCDVAGEE